MLLKYPFIGLFAQLSDVLSGIMNIIINRTMNYKFIKTLSENQLVL